LTPTPPILIAAQSPDGSTSPAPAARTEEPASRDGVPRLPAATFTFPNRILFGAGTRGSLASELARLGVARPLVVTDPGLLATGLVTEVLAPLGRQAVVSGNVQANPTEDDVLAGLALYRNSGCDGVVGLGGGSPIDAAKAIRLLVTHPGRLADYDLTQGGQDRIQPAMPAMVAIPTTAGTGSEAGRGALIQLPQTGRKTIVLSPHLLPITAICDPELTRRLPPELTAGTGMDAFSHCVESYLSITFHPICDGIAVEGLRWIFRSLETAVRDGSNLEARSAMMLGALLGGISFHKGLGVVHALSHALGSEGRVHHGTLNAILLPHALRFNREAAGPRMADLASRLGLGRSGNADGHLITLTELVHARLPLPRRLGQLDGLRHDRIPEYARLARLDHCHRTNPRPCTQADLESLLDQAW
jgi:alcohol dehydrogenase class IV